MRYFVPPNGDVRTFPPCDVGACAILLSAFLASPAAAENVYGPVDPLTVAAPAARVEEYRLPEAQPDLWIKRGDKWALLNAGASVADAALTCDAIKRGVAHEANPLLGGTCSKVLVRKSLFLGAQTLLFKLVQHRDPKKAAKVAKINFFLNGGAALWGIQFAFKGSAK